MYAAESSGATTLFLPLCSLDDKNHLVIWSIFSVAWGGSMLSKMRSDSGA